MTFANTICLHYVVSCRRKNYQLEAKLTILLRSNILAPKSK